MIYSIPKWNELYENSRSRKVKDLQWVPVPNSHDGEGYMRVMSHPRAAEIFTAWILILEVASKCVRRGFLVRDNGTPHTPESLALKTRANIEWFRLAFEFLSSEDIGWLSRTEDGSLPPAYQDATTTVPGNYHPSAEEENGREKKEGEEGKETADTASALTDRLLNIPACKRAYEVVSDPSTMVDQIRKFLLKHPRYPPDWWLAWVDSLCDDLPIRRAKFYGLACDTAVSPARVLEGEWKFRPPDPPDTAWAPDTDWIPVGDDVYEHISTGERRRA